MRSLFLLFTLLFSVSSWALEGQCSSFGNGLNGEFCVYGQVTRADADRVYHLHGRFSDAKDYGSTTFYHEQVREEWKAMGVPAPLVISISFGPVWLLAEKNMSPYSGLFELLRDRLIPEIETKLGLKGGRRILFGESMGGFNSLQLGLKTDLFQKVAALCAPIPFGVDPFSTPEEVNAVILKSTAYAYFGEKKRSEIDNRVGEMMLLGKEVFVNRDNWKKADPLTLAVSPSKEKMAGAFYLAAGFYDPFVLYEGNAELARRLKAAGVPVEWRAQWGGHCAIDIPSLARFLVQ